MDENLHLNICLKAYMFLKWINIIILKRKVVNQLISYKMHNWNFY